MKDEKLLIKPFYIYSIPEEILSTLIEEDKMFIISEKINESPIYELNKEIPLTCSICNEIKFNSQEEHRIHVKTDWHRFNIKRNAAKMPVLDFEEFEAALEDITESISGSDSGSKSSELDNTDDLFVSKTQIPVEDIIQPQKPKDPIIWTSSSKLEKPIHIGFYRCLFNYDNSQTFISVLRQNQLNTENKHRTISLIMVGGGNFAGMIVSLCPKNKNIRNCFKIDELNILYHKTFHYYTTRRKQGGSQIIHDSGKGAAISAGSSLRRYNEAALQMKIRQLLASWKSALDESELIFVKASGKHNRKILFGYENSVLSITDKRLRKIPFTTHRATRNELIRCFNELTISKIVEINTKEVKILPKIVTNVINIPKITKVDKVLEFQKKKTLEIILLIKEGDPQRLIDYMEKNSLSYDFEFHPILLYQHTSTPLHLSSSLSLSFIVTALLEKGADPTIRNGNGKTAYEIAGDKTTQYAFRLCRARLGEEKWDWRLAHVPSALTESEIKKREEHSNELKIKTLQREKLRRENELKKFIKNEASLNESSEKLKKKTIIPLSIGKTLQDQRNLSLDLQRRIEREKRARAAEERIKKHYS
ncbi:hypothetical protein PMAC_000367 [Pneumocystis sp. 'macacae']|nr:hypothetical protein PMAC_000367 [Pneumocystis sp. 'macacae']